MLIMLIKTILLIRFALFCPLVDRHRNSTGFRQSPTFDEMFCLKLERSVERKCKKEEL